MTYDEPDPANDQELIDGLDPIYGRPLAVEPKKAKPRIRKIADWPYYEIIGVSHPHQRGAVISPSLDKAVGLFYENAEKARWLGFYLA